MNFSKLDQAARDAALKAELPEEKVKLLEKYRLKSTPDLYWISEEENAYRRVVCRHSFLKKNDMVMIIGRLNGLCFAKVKYIRKTLGMLEPYTYDHVNGFVKTELWNSRFLLHVPSGYMLDYRELAGISDIEEFRKLCGILDSYCTTNSGGQKE